jgi:LacI family transcriptional regulator
MIGVDEAVTSIESMESGRRPTLKDVAEAAGVSRATASRVLRGTGHISDATRERVRAEMRRLGYVYHRGAASLRVGRTRSIGLIASDSSNLFMSEFISAFELAMIDRDLTTLICHSYEDLERQSLLIRGLLERGVDSLVIVPAVGSGAALTAQLEQIDVPVMVAVRPLEGWRGAFVGSDNLEGGRLVARHLLGHGARTFAYLGGPGQLTVRRDRVAGLGREIAEHASTGGIVADLEGGLNGAAGYQLASELIHDGRAFDALVCHNESIAFGVYRAFRELAPAIVADIRVVAFDDVEQAALWEPPLTTLAIDAPEVGRRTAGALFAQFEVGAVPQQWTSHPSLIVRNSCGCP